MKSAAPAETPAENLRTKSSSIRGFLEVAENGDVLRRFSSEKPTVCDEDELLYSADLCSVCSDFPHASTAITTKKKKMFLKEEETWS